MRQRSIAHAKVLRQGAFDLLCRSKESRAPHGGWKGGGRALGEEPKEVERPNSKEAQKTVPRIGLLL